MKLFQAYFLLIFLPFITTSEAVHPPYAMPGCNDTCGNVRIPYPFGIGVNCSVNEWYTVDCNSSTPYLLLKGLEVNYLQITKVDLENQIVTVKAPIFVSVCQIDVPSLEMVDLERTPFQYSRFRNKLQFMGCGNVVLREKEIAITGCSTKCRNDTTDLKEANNCFGINCCQTTVPHHLKSFNLTLTVEDRSCWSASFVDVDHENDFTRAREFDYDIKFVPVSLVWNLSRLDVSRINCCEEYLAYCDYNYPNYICQDVRLRYHARKAYILGASICIGVLCLVISSYVLYKLIKKTKERRRRKRFFKRNGGLLLKLQEEADPSLVDKTILFASRELEKATDNFNENRILGRGGQGTVYKGMLVDGRIVAVKKSKVVDESQLEQFINEVVILSQVNHRNVVKLLGCCLETEVPLLVSEFISNGTLYERLHNEADAIPICLNMRFQIATEVAAALAYLHSATSIPIYHRDIKTTNILLDDKNRAKVSDFGTSRFVSIDQTHLTTLVKGTFGYLDPEYFQSSQFTEKSDVYSFGVVLVELLTGERPISLTRFGEHRSLATYFTLAMEEDRVMSIFDATVIKEGTRDELLAVAHLALRCLNSKGRNRPTMKEVAIELETIRTSHIPSMV